jgi:hypothetical protein
MNEQEETQMPAFVIPVLIGIPVLVAGGYFVIHAIK